MNIEFIIPTYERTDHLMTILSSLKSQTKPYWRAHVVADCPDKDTMVKLNKIMEYYKDEYRIRFTMLDKRHNDWGHTPRNIGLSDAREEWLVMTGEDNYYMPTFVEEFLEAMYNPKVNFYYCDMVHNWVNQTYQPIKTRVEVGHIDIGCYMIKTEHIGDIRLDTTKPEADYIFLQEYLKKVSPISDEIIKINKLLYVHN
jgi:glycosyltransferase involved in cell wall biosynthesis